MKMIKVLCLAGLFLVCSTITGFTMSENVYSANERFVKPGDILNISVWDNSDLDQSLVVGPDGKINFPFLDTVHVADKTPEQVEEYLEGLLDQGFIVNPRVSVQLDPKSLHYFVVGEVRKPGTYEFQDGVSVLKAITVAGGLTDFASRNVKVIRKNDQGVEEEIRVNLNSLMKAVDDRSQYYLRSDDIIVVERSWF